MFHGILFKYVILELNTNKCEARAKSVVLICSLFLSAPVKEGLRSGVSKEKK